MTIRFAKPIQYFSLIAVAAVTLSFSTRTLAQQIQQSNEFVPGEVIVKLKGKHKSVKSQAFIGRAVSEKSMTLKMSFSGINTHHFALKSGQSVESAVGDLNNDPAVEFAEPNYIIHRQSNGVEGQTVSMSDVNSSSSGDGISASSYAFAQTEAPVDLTGAWSVPTPNLTPPIVAVIDTGLDYNHAVFTQTGAVWTNPNEIAANGIDDDKNGFIDDVHGWNFVSNTNDPMDDDGHGTHVSGIILGVSQDITQSTLKPAIIRIMPVKFLDSTGSGTTAAAIQAIYYATNNGARVLNNSWGGGGFSNSLLTAISYAYDHKAIFVAAAGNNTNNNDASPTYPANYAVPNIVSVAATSDSDFLASFSNYGATSVHLGSPGVSIWSTLPSNMYGRESGTSMATPFISGVAALVMREQASMTGYQAKQLILGAVQKISAMSGKASTNGRAVFDAPITSAKSVTISSAQPAFDLSAARMPASEDSGGGSSGGCGLVKKMMEDSEEGGPLSPFKNVTFFAVLVIMAAPIVVGVALRKKDDGGRSRRQFDRFQIKSAVTLKFGDRELVGDISTISLGGVQLNTDAWLEQGGVVKMSISSPDGQDEIKVEGKVVWSEQQKSYGVAFSNADDPVRSAISRWTTGLSKT